MTAKPITPEVRRIANVLVAAHHALTTSHGLWASDAPNSAEIWQLDHGAELGRLDALLVELTGGHDVPPGHWSDCATNSAPADPPGPCDCGFEDTGIVRFPPPTVHYWRRTRDGELVPLDSPPPAP